MMKKILLIMSLLAMTLFVVTACDKKDDDGNDGKEGSGISPIICVAARGK